MRTLAKDEALQALTRARDSARARGQSCLMCALTARGTSPCHPVPVRGYEHVEVFLDAFAARPGHLLLVTKGHYATFSEVPWPVYDELSRLSYAAGKLFEARGAKRVFVAQLGSPLDLPTTYAHAHVHVVPVDETDERARPAAVFSWSSGVLVYEEGEAEALALELGRGLSPLR